MKPETIEAYHAAQDEESRLISDALRGELDRALPEAESKLWHGHPAWVLDGNPVSEYSKLKSCVRLLF